jgi:hypothetical protein
MDHAGVLGPQSRVYVHDHIVEHHHYHVYKNPATVAATSFQTAETTRILQGALLREEFGNFDEDSSPGTSQVPHDHSSTSSMEDLWSAAVLHQRCQGQEDKSNLLVSMTPRNYLHSLVEEETSASNHDDSTHCASPDVPSLARPHSNSEAFTPLAQDVLQSCMDNAFRECWNSDSDCDMTHLDTQEIDIAVSVVDPIGSDPTSSPAVTMQQTNMQQTILQVQESLRKVLVRKVGSIKKAFEFFDINGSGLICLTEWLCALRSLKIDLRPTKIPVKDASALFSMMDTNGDGYLELHELLGTNEERCELNPEAMNTATLWRKLRKSLKKTTSSQTRRAKWETYDGDAGSFQLRHLDDEGEQHRLRNNIRREWKANRPRDYLPGRTNQLLMDPRLHRKCSSAIKQAISEETIHRENDSALKSIGKIKEAMHQCSDARRELVQMQQILKVPTHEDEEFVRGLRAEFVARKSVHSEQSARIYLQ